MSGPLLARGSVPKTTLSFSAGTWVGIWWLFVPDVAVLPKCLNQVAFEQLRNAEVQYGEIELDVSLIEVQKLMYFLQVAGEDMRLNYIKGHYGPYADNLRKAMRSMEGHFLTGFGDGSKFVQKAEPIKLLPGVSDAADRVLDRYPHTVAGIERVGRLSEGFESAYGRELLASVHWVPLTRTLRRPPIRTSLRSLWARGALASTG